MNSIIINQLNDFNKIIKQPILLTGKKELVLEEIYKNLWTINLSKKVKQKINKDILRDFINNLIKRRYQQVSQLKQPATIYFWNDSMIGDLRFNVLSGHQNQLPFESKVDLQSSVEPIIEEFIINNNSRTISWNELEFFDSESDPEEITHTTKVYSKFLTP